MRHPRYEEVVRAIDNRPTMPKGGAALARVREAFARARVAFPASPNRTLIVAGTNGKGSVSKMLDTLLRAAGARTGLYTSPHLVTMRERIQIDGSPIREEEFVRLYDLALPVADALELTHFEISTLLAALAFTDSAAPVDWAIYEVGMGGRWDATNAVPHGACAITALGMDHQAYLGDTIELIAAEKFGVVGAGNIVVHAPFPSASVAELAKAKASETGSVWREAAAVEFRVDESGRFPRFHISTAWGEAELSLPGKRAAENAAVALTLLDSLGVDVRPLLPALAKVNWPGRMQRIDAPFSNAPVFFSGDHNPQGVASLVDLLKFYRRKNLHLVVGIASGKDGEGMLAELASIPGAKLYLTSPGYRRRALSSYGEKTRALAAGFWDDAWTALREVGAMAGPEDLVVVTGSLYLIGELMARLENP